MITTARLEIRPFKEEDAFAFFELSNDNGFNLFPITKYRQESADTARKWIRETVGKWAVIERDTGKLIGMGGLTSWTFENETLTDITYRLRESAWGKGYGPELAKGLVEYGFRTLNLKQITATITPDNEASKKIAEMLGMKFDKRITLLGVPTDLYRLYKE